MTAGDLRLALHQIAPADVPLTVVNSMSALRVVTQGPTRPSMLRPVWPTKSLGPSPSGQPPARSRP